MSYRLIIGLIIIGPIENRIIILKVELIIE